MAVEFGGADGTWFSNTALFRDAGWTVMQYDLKENLPYVFKKEITTENVNELPDNDLLSIDVDGNDYYIWEAYKGQPKIVIIEVNSSFHPTVDCISSLDANKFLIGGTSYKSMLHLGISKNYFLICHTGNMIFAKNQYRYLFPEIEGDGLDNWADYFTTNWLYK